jgi:AcrR family transcriptional regulator
MPSVNQTDPRANQKARTREAIIKAAQALQGDGTTPTIEQAAERARVSRATAYRYFPTKEALWVELADITPGLRPVEELLAHLSSSDVEQRLLAVLDTFHPIVLSNEEHYRTAVRVYQDTWLRGRRNDDEAPVVREGRRMRWLDDVLAPLDDLPSGHKERLKSALALTLGIESIIIMKDVCRLDNDQALAILRWAAKTLLNAAVEQNPTPLARTISHHPTGNHGN